MQKKDIYILLIYFLFCIKCISQEKKVSVVLSGGGSKAFMHIGLLKLLEDNNIKINNIGGSSMGALIASLYASGYSIKEIIKIISSERSISATDGKFLPHFQTEFYNLNYDYNLISINFNNIVSTGDLLPSSIISSLPLQYFLLKYFYDINLYTNNYDSLMIPLRITASEIQQKKLFLFKRNDLSERIRASVSYPFYLNSVTIEDSLIFMDGGLYNNFPIENIYNEFKPDVMLGSFSSLKLPKAVSNNILSQFITLISLNNNYELPKNTKGFILNHDITNISTFDFSNPQKLIDAGIRESNKYKQKLIELNLDTINIDSLREKFVKNITTKSFIKNIYISGCKKNQINYLTSILQINKEGYDLNFLEKKISLINDDDRFNNLILNVNEKESNSLNIKSSDIKKYSLIANVGSLISTNGTLFEFITGGRYRFFVNRFLFDIEGNFIIGNFQLSTEARLRIDIPYKVPTYFLLRLKNVQYDFFNWQSSFFKSQNPDYLIVNNQFVDYSYNIPITRKLTLEIGDYIFNNNSKFYLDNKIRFNADSNDNTFYKGNNFYLSIIYNTLNSNNFPTEGTKFILKSNFINYKFNSKYLRYNDIFTSVENNNNKNFIFESQFEKYFVILKVLKVGIDLRYVWSDINKQKDYYSTITTLPYYMPITEFKTSINDDYISNSYFAIGGKIILHPSSKQKQLSLRIESYHIIKDKSIIRSTNNEVVLNDSKFKENIFYELEKYTIISSSLIWKNKILPLSFTGNFFNANKIGNKFSFYFTIGYIFKDKKRGFF